MKLTKTLIAVLVFATAAANLQAQKNWSYEFGLAGTLNSGNINNIGFNTNAGVGRNDSIRAVYANVHFVYTEENKETTNRGLDGTIKYDYYRNTHWNPFLAAEFVTNHFKGYDFKTSFLAGIKYNFVYEATRDYSISAALVGDYVNFYTENPLADTLDGYKLRVSIRGQIRQKIGENTTLYHATFYQPSIFDFSDYIISSITKVSNKLNDHVFFDVIFDYGYRSVVPEEKKHYDIATQVAVKIKF